MESFHKGCGSAQQSAMLPSYVRNADYAVVFYNAAKAA